MTIYVKIFQVHQMHHVIVLCQTKLRRVFKLIALKGTAQGLLKNFTWKCLVEKTINSSSILLHEVLNYLHVVCPQEDHSFFVFTHRMQKDEAEV